MAHSFLLGGLSHPIVGGLLYTRAHRGVTTGDRNGAAYTKSAHKGRRCCLPRARAEEGGAGASERRCGGPRPPGGG
jgi:hypothetical protein